MSWTRLRTSTFDWRAFSEGVAFGALPGHGSLNA